MAYPTSLGFTGIILLSFVVEVVVHPRTDHKASEVEQRYSTTLLFLTLALEGVGG